jgi:hypothetical protein
MAFEYETGIPVPEGNETGKYAGILRGIPVGQSAFFEKVSPKSFGPNVTRTRKSIPGSEFITKTMLKDPSKEEHIVDNPMGVRVWRKK